MIRFMTTIILMLGVCVTAMQSTLYSFPLSFPCSGVGTGEENRWNELFNGKDLTGWTQLGGGTARVEKGVLILEHDPQRRPGYLVADLPPVRDFEAIVVCRVPTGDSGFFFRGKRHPLHATEFMGPQVQLNQQPGRGLGGIFELHGRCWVCKPEAAPLVKAGEWLTCAVTAQGPRLQVTINGVRVVDVTDAGADNHFQGAGRFALQIHGGGYCRAEFRRLAFRRLQ